MAANAKPIGYTEIELQSYLPSGWGIVPGQRGAWDSGAGAWSVDIYDGADHVWKLTVDADDATKAGRIAALKDSVRHLNRHALGRKSIISG